MLGNKVVSSPLVAALVALAVRLLAHNFSHHIHLPYHFGITTSKTGSEIWKEAVFWKQQFGVVPAFLTTVGPWFMEYIPPASSDAYVIFLCLCDALTVYIVSRWPSAKPQLTYALFVLNPIMALLPMLESLAPLEHVLLAVILECCRKRRIHPWLIFAARLLAPLLGFHFIAIIVALWYPVGTPCPKIALVGVALCTACIGGCGMLYLRWWGEHVERTSLYSPPDNGVMWYVRLLIMAAFHRSMEVGQIELPAVLTLIFSTGVPCEKEAAAETMKDGGAIPGDRRLLVTLLAICFSKLFCEHVILADYMITVFFLYSLLEVKGRGGFKSMLDRVRGLNIFLPICTLLLGVPLQYAFYTGWVMWDMANPNWVFFPQVAFVTGGGLFLLAFVNSLVDAMKEECVAGITKEKQA
ncbi:GPI transamidase component Tta2 [Trypanosoma equiperdum]|uniref:GPI transamidase component Tta2 n=4 Tax=Trypanozoon TaxID=39700 RepID=Q38B93_TRYB2|nr:hypothetical protein, conserved [Trypanosoma brucei brucei TREU927]EAN77927.1 hypothetical protein, conserved [Trypanosoma brucei brucei TREU927]RHW69049.1 GPI transamidase component Tta2 [Trypanosoma brucei equiperdum]BAC81738.1 GPI transamidase component TTA2 [Trypanosoma brucei brucei]SCU68609.1 GPI transamidase component Tta2 [Trypanosoma equiperdum]